MALLVKDNYKSTYKKVVVRRLDHGLMKGFVDSSSYLGPDGIRMLDREGRTLTIPLHETLTGRLGACLSLRRLYGRKYHLLMDGVKHQLQTVRNPNFIVD